MAAPVIGAGQLAVQKYFRTRYYRNMQISALRSAGNTTIPQVLDFVAQSTFFQFRRNRPHMHYGYVYRIASRQAT